MNHDTIQNVADAATKAQYGGSLVAGIFYFINEYAAAIGVLIAFLGFLVIGIGGSKIKPFNLD